MTHSFTPQDLIRFIYHEVTSEEEQQIKNFISENADAAKEFSFLMDAVMELDSVSLEPSDSSVDIILNFSREYVPEESHA